MKVNEDKFEQQLEKIKNSNIELTKTTKQKQGDKHMKSIKKINWKKIIETIKTLVIYTAIISAVAFYLGVQHGEANMKLQNEKIVETARNLSQNK